MLRCCQGNLIETETHFVRLGIYVWDLQLQIHCGVEVNSYTITL